MRAPAAALKQPPAPRLQDVWDFAMSFWCDHGRDWFLPQKADMRLGIDDAAADYVGLPFAAVTPGGVLSERGAVYSRTLADVTKPGGVDEVR